MDHITIKKEILELKLDLVKIRIEKKLRISYQQYEKVADLRDQEKQMLVQLEEKKNILVEKQKEFQNQAESIEELYQLLSNINEILIFHTPTIHFEEVLEDFNAHLLIEYDELFKKKRALLENQKFKEASEIQKQILEIGNFLLKCGE